MYLLPRDLTEIGRLKPLVAILVDLFFQYSSYGWGCHDFMGVFLEIFIGNFHVGVVLVSGLDKNCAVAHFFGVERTRKALYC